jgi:bacillopeptidase F
MGTILGGDGPGPFTNDIGVAPGATFVAARAFWFGFGFDSWILDCMEWIADLVSQGVNVRVVSNSWGYCDQTDLTFWNSVLTWRSLEIIPVFAIGNAPNCGYSEPPPYGTATTPGNFPTVIGVGATDNYDNIASFSLRGPAPNQNPWNDPSYWGRSDWNLIKPDISAPGVNVRSSVPGGSYEVYSGTSMACPHVAGVVALLLSKDPDLSYEEIYNVILDNAHQPSQGSPYPNNIYGWGRVDALAAINALPGPYLPGDANGDGVVNSADLVYLAYYIFSGGPPPDPYLAGDANGDCTVSSLDLTYLAQYLYGGGPEPQMCSD